jgi:hypothetical protein
MSAPHLLSRGHRTRGSALCFATVPAIHGAIEAKAVTSNASPVIHYDIALRTTVIPGFDTPYAVADWRETNPGI